MDPAYLPAAQALSLFRARKLSPLELLDAQIARAERLNPDLRAFADTYFDEAAAAARMAEARYRSGDARPLEGLTCAVKDEFQIAGKRATQGSLTLVDNIARETDVVIERVLAAGAIVHARTTTPEFCLIGVTHSKLCG